MSDEIENTEDESPTGAEPVLSDAEKDALLDGIESGAVEVHSAKGPVYAEVRDFVISPRSHIISNSLPRLELLNGQLSNVVSKSAERLLGTKARVQPGAIEQLEFGSLLEREPRVFLIVPFDAPPLEGIGLVCLDSGLVAQLVECFYGGGSKPAVPRTDFYTAGEKRVARKFSEAVLDGLATTWEALSPIKPEASGLNLSTDLIDGIDASTEIFDSSFTLTIGDSERSFRIVWPEDTIKPLLPALKDQKRDADPAQDANWQSVLRETVTDSIVRISSRVGQTRMRLRDVAGLSAGDIIDIANPRRTVIYAKDVPVLEGLFGVHDGRYAIEATRWLSAGNDSNTQ